MLWNNEPDPKGAPDGEGEAQKRNFPSSFSLRRKGGFLMSDSRLAVVSIIVEDTGCAERLNAVLHEFGEYVVGRMGIPYRQKKVSVLSVVVDAPQEKINALTGKLGMIGGVSAKTLFSKY